MRLVSCIAFGETLGSKMWNFFNRSLSVTPYAAESIWILFSTSSDPTVWIREAEVLASTLFWMGVLRPTIFAIRIEIGDPPKGLLSFFAVKRGSFRRSRLPTKIGAQDGHWVWAPWNDSTFGWKYPENESVDQRSAEDHITSQVGDDAEPNYDKK